MLDLLLVVRVTAKLSAPFGELLHAALVRVLPLPQPLQLGEGDIELLLPAAQGLQQLRVLRPEVLGLGVEPLQLGLLPGEHLAVALAAVREAAPAPGLLPARGDVEGQLPMSRRLSRPSFSRPRAASRTQPSTKGRCGGAMSEKQDKQTRPDATSPQSDGASQGGIW